MNDRRLYKNTFCQTDARRIERLYNAVERFEYSPELAKRVYHIGVPYFTDSISTASLTVTEKGKPVFSFNRTFFDGLGRAELVFVVLHEVLHFVFCHHLRCHDRLPALWNIATDIVINAFLLQKIGFAEVSNPSFQKFLESAITFTNLPIAPTSDRLLSLTAEEVYDLLVENLQGIMGKASNFKACDEHIWLGSSTHSGSEQDESPDENLVGIEKKASNSEGSDEYIPSEPDTDGVPEQDEALDENLQNGQGESSNLADAGEHGSSGFSVEGGSERSDPLDELAERAQRVFRNWLPGWGNTPSGELRAIGEIHKSSNIDWDYILSKCIASCIQLGLEERWAPPNRKFAWLYPDVLLPAEHQVEQYQSSLLMAIDSSGSITRPVLDRLVGVARTVPTDRVELTALSFDTRVYPFDFWQKVPQIRGGGGTRFDIIEDYVKLLSKYPDLIVVLTDGLASRPTVKYPNRWFWLITPCGTPRNIQGIGRYCVIGYAQPSLRATKAGYHITDKDILFRGLPK